MNNIDNTEVLLYNIINCVDASIYWKNLEGQYLGCNSYTLQMMGIQDIKDIIGKTDYDMPWKKIADKLREIDNYVIEHGGYSCEESPTLANQESKTFLTNKTQLLDKNNNIIGIIGISIDITAQKKAEELEIQNIIFQEKLKSQEVLVSCLKDVKNMLEITQHNLVKDHDHPAPNQHMMNTPIKLTKREKEILYYLSMNKSPKEIANILGKKENKQLSSLTILSIIDKQLYVKFDVPSVSKLLEKAMLLNLIPFLPN